MFIFPCATDMLFAVLHQLLLVLCRAQLLLHINLLLDIETQHYLLNHYKQIAFKHLIHSV